MRGCVDHTNDLENLENSISGKNRRTVVISGVNWKNYRKHTLVFKFQSGHTGNRPLGAQDVARPKLNPTCFLPIPLEFLAYKKGFLVSLQSHFFREIIFALWRTLTKEKLPSYNIQIECMNHRTAAENCSQVPSTMVLISVYSMILMIFRCQFFFIFQNTYSCCTKKDLVTS